MNSVSINKRVDIPSLRILSQCGRLLTEKRMLPDIKCLSMVKRENNYITFSVRDNDRCYFRTKNLKSGFRVVPTGSAAFTIPQSIDGLKVDFDPNFSGTGRLILHILAFSDTERVASLRISYLSDANDQSSKPKQNFLELPSGTVKIGYAVRLQGEGRFIDDPIRIFFLSNSQFNTDQPLSKSNQETLDESYLAREKFQNLASKVENRVNLIPQLLSDRRDYVRKVASEYLDKNSDNSEDVRLLFLSLKNSRRSLIALEILESYGSDLGVIRHQLYLDALNELLKMSEICEYYENLNFRDQQDPAILRRYLTALSWTGRDDELIILLKELILYPNIARGMIPSLVRYSELLDDESLKIITQVILNQRPRNLNPLHVMNFYDQLAYRGMKEVASKLDHFIDSYKNSENTVLRINMFIFQANLAFHDNSPSKQLESINMSLTQSGLDEVNAIEVTKFLSAENVKASSIEPAEELSMGDTKPLVTIIMTTFNSTSTLSYAINSILGQTHKALELIVVDDASNDGTQDMIKDLARLDPRIRPILLTSNGGTYVAKNHGRAVATGKYVTCHDSDDWAHPQKIERLATFLEENPEIIGVEGGHIRISEDSGIQRRIGGGLKPDASSLMYRNAQVTKAIGFYDNVRAGADGEFKYRLQKYFGLNSVVFLRELLSIVKWAEGTLSGKGSAFEISYLGVFADARLKYRHRFQKTHEYEVIKHGTSSLYMPQQQDNATENQGV